MRDNSKGAENKVGEIIKTSCKKTFASINFLFRQGALMFDNVRMNNKQQFEKAKSHLQVYLGQLGYHVDIKQSVNGLKVRI